MEAILIKNDRLNQSALMMVNLTAQTKALSVCDILAEINKLNDNTLAHFLGTLNFNYINIQYYNVDILDAVPTNNAITFYSNANLYGNDAIEITMVVKQKNANTEKVIINGNFIYTFKNDIVLEYSLS